MINIIAIFCYNDFINALLQNDLIVDLRDTYNIKSNRESGSGTISHNVDIVPELCYI